MPSYVKTSIAKVEVSLALKKVLLFSTRFGALIFKKQIIKKPGETMVNSALDVEKTHLFCSFVRVSSCLFRNLLGLEVNCTLQLKNVKLKCKVNFQS